MGIAAHANVGFALPSPPPVPSDLAPNFYGRRLDPIQPAAGWSRVPGDDHFTFLPPTPEEDDTGGAIGPGGIRWTYARVEYDAGGRLRLYPAEIPVAAMAAVALRGGNTSPFGSRANPPGATFATVLEWIRGERVREPAPLIVYLDPPEPTFTVGIYAGRGSWPENVTALQNFLAHFDIPGETFAEGDLPGVGDRFDAIWFPGGFSAEYRAYVPDHERIREYVAGGGVFLGVCAGAYYAATIMVWEGEARDGALGLLDGRAVGPEPRLASWGRPTPVTLREPGGAGHGPGETVELYYLDGPYFLPDDPEAVEVLARYQVNGEAAIVASDFGAGRVVLMGPHPELGRDEESGAFDLEGGGGARWDWLHALLRESVLR